MHPNKKYHEVPDVELHPLDKFILSNLVLGYTPVTNITRNIMQKVSTEHLPDVIITEEYANEKEMITSSLSKSSNFVGVVFKDFMSYELRFFPDMIPVSSVYMDSRAGCSKSCEAAQYWSSGFTVLQASIDAAIIQVMHLEDLNEGALFSNLTEGPYPLIITIILLALNSVFYVLVAIYLDQVIPGEFGLRRSSFYFLKLSYWSKSKRNYKELSEGNVNGSISFSEIIEPVSSEFIGKEAIRIIGIQKTHRKKGENVEALRNLSFDIYEGQITALLGHSGTGKSTLMNILCGLCPPSDGFASIYGYRVSEIDEMFEARKMIGICPQLDIHFDVLTVEENLSILASIRGIPANNIIQEVQKVLLDLDMQAIKDNQAKKLSGGQKRKLSLGIAVLGNPKVLLLDEPTAGMDPCSRHIVWNLLKYRKANRVTVFSTHFMDEADILAGLFFALDTHSNLGVISYGVSLTTLEDVFLKLEVEAEIDQADYSVFTQQPPEEEMDSKSFDEMEQSLLILSETKASLVSTMSLWKQQVYTIARFHLLTLRRESKSVRSVLLLLLIFFTVQIFMFLVHHSFKNAVVPTKLVPDLYFLKPGDKPHKYKTSLLLQNSTDSDIDDLISFFTKQNIMVTMFNDSDYVSAAPHSAALNVMHSEEEITDIVFKVELYFQAALLGIIVTAMPPYFAMENAENHKIKAYTQLKLSGLLPSAYWIGQAIVDIPLFFVVLILMLGSLFAFHYGLYFYAVKFLAVTALACIAVTEITYFMGYTVTVVLHYTFCIAIPIYPLLGCLISFIKPYLQCVLWIFLLQYYEKKYGGRSIRKDPFFRTFSTKSKNRKFPEPPNKEDEDDDVRAERLKVKELMSCQCCEEEILGLLGPNGAGKSTIINILVGDIEPTSGQVFLGDYSSDATEDDSIKCMGYCPQINPLWPDITLQEHFEIYGSIKGMSTSDMKEVISRITNVLDLKEHLQKTIKKLPAGIKRKLCFALSMLGNPQVTLLDEPSTGMDPKAKQHMWRAIRTAFKNKKRAAILTTHYMEEAEAVCDRVAIMVSGQLRCIGTVQHLKSKFGKGYFLEIKLKDWIENLEVDRLQREIQYIFPNASRQESFSSILAYKIPKEDVQSLSQSFSKLEEENVQLSELPPLDLGRVDKLNRSTIVVYTPVSTTTQQIMNKTALAPILKGKKVIGVSNEENMDEILLYEFPYAVGVIFNDAFFYKLKFIQGYYIPFLEKEDFSAHCQFKYGDIMCSLTRYWNRGFVTLQTAINAAIIEIALTFLMSVLLKKAGLTNLVVFLLIFFWGCMGFTAFYKQLPSSLEWILSICSPFAFTAGMTQIIHLDFNLSGVTFPDPSGNSYIMIATFFMLAFDGLIYLVLALYFDKLLPYGGECHYSPEFCLNSSSCFKHERTDNQVTEKEIDSEHLPEDCFEPVAPEFQGKEAIRIRNIKKEYKGKSGKVEALKGSVTIYNKNPSEIQDLEEIRKITGICPQFNVQFDTLTVKENLSLFAKIKGIHQQQVEQEVQQILLELDMQNIQDKLAKFLSEGQKRKLTFGIAILGDPQVLLLDDPTAGLDPFSRHQVWSFLRERRADRVILLSTQFMEEADILADRKVVMSNGRLKCAGSSVFLKRKWGLGYHLSLYRNEICDPEQIASFINHHIPDAKLKTENKEKLVYTLPLERTNKFSDLFSDLDKCSGQGLMSYDISMSNLNEVFIQLEEKSTIEQDFEQAEIRDSESLNGMETARSSLPEMQRTVNDMGLWRMQVFAMARLRFLKLKRERKALLTLLLAFGTALFPLIVETIFNAVLNHHGIDWEFKNDLYFLSPGKLPHEPLTSLLIINNTESDIEDFIQSLKHQNILLEVDDFKNRNGTDALSYNGAIIVSGKQRNPMLLDTGLPEGSLFLLHLASSMSPFIAMSSISDYKVLVITANIILMSRYSPIFIITSMLLLPSTIVGGFPSFIDMSRSVQQNPEEPVDEDEDVQAERIRTEAALTTSNLDEKPVIIANCLHKEYAGQKRSCFSKRKRKIAARNISFCVKKGEVLGLLGPNGAGKSTSIRMISGIIKPTAGEVELKECSSGLGHQGDGTVKFLGYCPQGNVLWPTLTMKEHLEVYAAVKGLRKGAAEAAITRLVDAFKLHEQLNVPVQKLTAGSKRKLCFVLSILGNSPVLLLDEPSTGMDPTGQQQMWQAIQATAKNKERGVLLITHYLAEAEALCDRVAIIVSGKLRCIGSIEHLKSKFGKDYILELKVKDISQVTLVHMEILKIFPQAAQQERHSSLLVYKLPIAEVYPLSQAFHKLETVKHNFNLEEYTLSQCTLEKVFLELSKEQEVENFDEEVDTNMRWKLLHSEEP
ncbi:ATP-binding cassette sub-family A member 5 [Tupaia chinensis]|uniref:ATP-binding cassette sub-family A member 5 n=1 Tax=Tupaia chinensis TaxID=246437 RepID=L9KXA8_TUPCH|nr:ATP-binding cassette sub-family A member 5 [Tupaia chinensis]